MGNKRLINNLIIFLIVVVMSDCCKGQSLITIPKCIIFPEDVIMKQDTFKYGSDFKVFHDPNVTTLELIPRDYFIDNMPTYGPKLLQESQIEKLQSEVDELKSQVKELSILLKELLESKK